MGEIARVTMTNDNPIPNHGTEAGPDLHLVPEATPAKERYPDYEFDLSSERLIGSEIITVLPRRRIVRLINQLAETCPNEIPEVTADHHLFNFLGRERKAIARGVRDLPNVEGTTEALTKSNHPIAQMFNQLDRKYGDGEELSAGQLRAIKADILIIAEHTGPGIFRKENLGHIALDATEETD